MLPPKQRYIVSFRSDLKLHVLRRDMTPRPPKKKKKKLGGAAYGETLAAELAPLNIRVLLVAPGAFDAGVIPPFTETLPGYESAHDVMDAAIKKREASKKGDPARGMDTIIDVVRGEGRAASLAREGKWPRWLVLGEDAFTHVRKRIQDMADTLDEWETVGSDVYQQ
jgi:hypothetical protein